MKSKAIDTQSKVYLLLYMRKDVSGYEWEEAAYEILNWYFGLVLILGVACLAVY